MAHLTKFTRSALGNMFKHYDRSADNINNDNLDRELTHLNYNLATHQTISQYEFMKKRVSEVRCQKRDDVNLCCDWVVTLPQDVQEQDERRFFELTYDFLTQRYGKENVISAYVHKDEVTPHLHYAFVPVTYDKKRDCYKVSAKEVVNRQDLTKFHSDLSNFVEKGLGYHVSVLNDATEQGNRSIQELKRKSATERMLEVEKAEFEANLKLKQADDECIKFANAKKSSSGIFKTRRINESEGQVLEMIVEKNVKLNEKQEELLEKQAELLEKQEKLQSLIKNYEVATKDVFEKQAFFSMKTRECQKKIKDLDKIIEEQVTERFEKAIQDAFRHNSTSREKRLSNFVEKMGLKEEFEKYEDALIRRIYNDFER